MKQLQHRTPNEVRKSRNLWRRRVIACGGCGKKLRRFRVSSDVGCKNPDISTCDHFVSHVIISFLASDVTTYSKSLPSGLCRVLHSTKPLPSAKGSLLSVKTLGKAVASSSGWCSSMRGPIVMYNKGTPVVIQMLLHIIYSHWLMAPSRKIEHS